MIDLLASIVQYSLGLGYLGAFVLGFFSTFTLFLPSPSFVGVAALSLTHIYNPFLLGIFGGLGATIGEMIGYLTGYGGDVLLRKKYEKEIKNIEKYFQKHGGFFIIFVASAAPVFPFDVVGIFCGVVGYPFKKFFLATLIGKVIKYIVLAYMGFYGIEFLHLLT